MASADSTTLITINTVFQTPIKLTNSNYLSWKLQFQTLLIGYDILGYVDGTKPCPEQTVKSGNTTSPNPAYSAWVRQDQLILNAIVGSLSSNIVPFISTSKTSKHAWDILASIYAKPSRGRIKHIKQQIKDLSKGSLSTTEYLQTIKSKTDELSLLGSPMDIEDIIDIIFAGLGE